MDDKEPMTVPVPRPGLLEEYQQYSNAVDEHNRKVMASACGSPQWYIDEMYSPLRQAPRCEHIRAEGLRCQAPALRGRKLCYAHTRMLAGRKAGLQLPALEDSSGIALAVMQIVQQMLDGTLERKSAAVALYGIQIVAGTLRHKPFSPKPTSVVLEAPGLPAEEELLAWANLASSPVPTGPVPAVNSAAQTDPNGLMTNDVAAGEIETASGVVMGKPQRRDADSRRSAEKKSEDAAIGHDPLAASSNLSSTCADGPMTQPSHETITDQTIRDHPITRSSDFLPFQTDEASWPEKKPPLAEIDDGVRLPTGIQEILQGRLGVT